MTGVGGRKKERAIGDRPYEGCESVSGYYLQYRSQTISHRNDTGRGKWGAIIDHGGARSSAATRRLSRGKFCTENFPVGKVTRGEKVGKPSPSDEKCYVNKNAYTNRYSALVEKSVDNVENSQLSTVIYRVCTGGYTEGFCA